jgi:4-amino-4-deoxy-L-arabinose transferase-like glycosyltransferase
VSVPRRLGKPSSGVQAVVVGILLVAPSLIWIFRDHSVWPWDPAWYGQVSVDLWSTLRLHPAKWSSAMVHAFGAKPPGIAWLGQLFVPFGYKFGNVRASLLLSSVACQIATVALLFAAGRKLTGSAVAGLATALLVAAGPLFVSMSHEFFAEPMQTLSIGVDVAARTDDQQRLCSDRPGTPGEALDAVLHGVSGDRRFATCVPGSM